MAFARLIIFYLITDLRDVHGASISTSPSGVYSYKASGEGLTILPGDIPPNIDLIYLPKNDITSLDPFPAFLRLGNLQVPTNDVALFPDLNVVSSTLTHLDLSYNRIEFIPPDLLDCLVNLVELKIDGNLLSSIPNVAGPGQTLQKLTISGNRLTDFPRLSLLGPKMTSLFVSNNRLRNVDPDNLRWLPKLSLLALHSNPLRIFPDLSVIGKTLANLGVDNCLLKEIPAERLSSLEVLASLSASNNYLTEFPDFASSPSRHTLLHVFAHWNNIASIPGHRIRILPTLMIIGAGGNELVSLPNWCHQHSVYLMVMFNDNPMICDVRLRWTKVAATYGLMPASNPTCLAPPSVAGSAFNDVDQDQLPWKEELRRSLNSQPVTDPYRCHIPAVSHWTSTVSQGACTGRCMQTPGCFYFRFVPGPVSGSGNCGLTDGTGSAVAFDGSTMRDWYVLE